jgi:hypothetical protein
LAANERDVPSEPLPIDAGKTLSKAFGEIRMNSLVFLFE